MYNVACQEASGLACPFIAEGETAEQAMMNLMSHGKEMHAGEMEKMMAEGMTEEMMTEKIKAATKMS